MARILTGLGDGCDSCLAPRSTWSDVEAIEDGFVMDRSYQQIQETWKNLPRDSNGDLIKATGDYATRQGLCHPPVSLREPTSYSITHKVIQVPEMGWEGWGEAKFSFLLEYFYKNHQARK